MPRGAGIALILVVLTLAAFHSASAQTQYRVVDVEVQGNRVATTSLILDVSSIAKGSPLTPTIIQSTLHRLYGLGIFRDVHLEAEEVSGGLKVIIVVQELPKLVALEFDGNNKIKDKDLKEKTGLGVGGYISPYLIESKKQEILTAYADKGYFQAKVKPELTYNADSTEASLKYKIDERSKVKVEKVVMTGNERVNSGDLIKKMRNRPRGFLKSSDFAQEKFPEDKEKVIEEYHKKGYLDAYLISDSSWIDTTRNRMTIFLNVYEGPRYYFGTSTFDGNEILPDEVLARALKYKEGEVFNSEKYDETMMELYSAYQEIGHLHVRIFDEKTTRGDSLLDMTFTISEGLPSHINLVKITGNTRTKDRVIRRELASRPGQVFNRTLLIRSVREAMALNFFTNVEPVPHDLPNGDVDLEFKVDEKQTGQVSAGAGYNSEDKVVGSVGLGIPNLFGNGQSVSFSVDFGSTRNSFSISFTEPWLFGRPTSLGVDLFALNRRWYDEYTEGQQGFAIRVGRRLRWPDNYFRIYTSYRLERNRFYDYDDTFLADNSTSTTNYYTWTEIVDTVSPPQLVHYSQTDELVGEPLQGSVVAYNEEWNTASKLSVTLSRDSRNLPEFATKGSSLSYQYSMVGGLLGGFWRYQLHRFSAAKFVPLFWKFALATRFEYGAIDSWGHDPGDRRVLLSDRFTPGGTAYDGTVRGYDDGDLTPDSLVAGVDTVLYFYNNPDSVKNPSIATADSSVISSSFTTRVRGKFMITANAEIQLPIVENQIYGLLFLDAGNSWLHFDDIQPISGLYKGAGFGFRIVVPGIGTLGFDFAKPLDDPPDGSDRSWKPHFQVGTTIR